MDETDSLVSWTQAYLQWMDLGAQPFEPGHAQRGAGEASAGAGKQWADVYLEWIDMAEGAPSLPGSRYDDDMRNPGVFREAILLTALRTESECMRILRQRLESAAATPRMVELAAEALRHAERLLDDERFAWQALSALRKADRRRSHASQPAASAASWEHALEGVAADVHGLASTLLALQRPPVRRRHARM